MTSTWWDVRGSAAEVGARAALEIELARLTGALARATSGPGARRFLAAASAAHSWRAEQWDRLLPVSIGLPTRAELVVLAESDAAVASSLASSLDSAQAVAGLPSALLEIVYPALLAVYERLDASANRLSDGPLAVAAARSAHDLRRVLSEGMAAELGESSRDGVGGEPPAVVRNSPSVRSRTDGDPAHDGDPAA